MKTLLQNIRGLAGRLGREVRLMEVCGTHTMAAFRSGLRQLLPPSVKLISGPGCPVCVTDTSYIDAAIGLCRAPEVMVATFGDLLRVPGSESSLERERAVGANVRVVYSPSDALALARSCPSKRVVFLGVGFETTAPTVAWSIARAARDQMENYTVLVAHKTMPGAMEALLKDHEVKLDGFICPGHVSVITGAGMYRFICQQYHIPCVVSGFEAWDMLKSIQMLLAQTVAGQAEVQIEYSRSVNERGNVAAQELVAEVFEPCDAAWRGLGTIAGSGLAIRPKYARYDAARVLGITFGAARVQPGCRCGDVLRGVATPPDCKLFGRACTPLNPFGPCMVSNEGTCAAVYKYEKRRRDLAMTRDRILLAHGGGGSLTRELIEELFLPAFDNPLLRPLDDSAVLAVDGARLAFTTDSYVVKPYLFPGGDIGKLAVCGTVNDLAVQGAQPLWLSLGLILEEGLPLADLEKIVASIRQAAAAAGATVVTGDTKVVERGKCEGLYINTAGIGRLVAGARLSGANAHPGDAVIVNGFLAEHGVAVMSQREGIGFATSVVSDCAPLWPLVNDVLASGAAVHAMRDPTRGGLAAAVSDMAKASGVGIRLWETALPISREVRGACDLLGLDPLTIANEGKLLVICAGADAARVVAAMKQNPLGREARIIGEVTDKPKGLALLRTAIGGERIIDLPSGEDLPRIC